MVTKAGKAQGANRIVIDLDPGDGAGLHECCQVALLVRDKLAERNLETEAVTSGSKGMHLYAALTRRKTPDDSTALAKEVADELAKEHSRLVTATMTKSKRSGKVFLDWSQNAGSKTTLSPYSLRGRELPTVATPVSWGEVEAGAEDPLGLEQFRYEDVIERLAERNLETEAVTSGSKGLNLYAALQRRKDPDDSTALAKEVAEDLAKEHSRLVTATMTKSKRSGKVFLDWSQNAGSKTTLSPYSLRGRELPTVATPVTWDEVEAGADDPLGLEQFRFEEVLERLADGR
jgi:DNA primase